MTDEWVPRAKKRRFRCVREQGSCVREDIGGAPVIAVRSGADDEVAVGAVLPGDARVQSAALGVVWEVED